MLKFSEYLPELFNKSEFITWIKQKYDHWKGTATTPGGQKIMINIFMENEREMSWELVFSVGNSMAKTGKGESLPVFSTVIKGLEQFLRERKNDVSILTFDAAKEMSEKEGSRGKLYSSLIKRFAKKHGFELHDRVAPRVIEYKLVKK
jgi:hypothetical protein